MSADGYIKVDRRDAGFVDLRCWKCSKPIVSGGALEQQHAACFEELDGERILRYSIEVYESAQT